MQTINYQIRGSIVDNYNLQATINEMTQMGIPLTPVRSADILAAWKMARRVLALITLERSKKWTTGFAARRVAATIFVACAGPMDLFAVIVGLSRSRG